MLLEEELAKDAPTNIGSNQEGNYQNMDKKDKGPKSDEVDALNC